MLNGLFLDFLEVSNLGKTLSNPRLTTSVTFNCSIPSNNPACCFYNRK
jgi:hypothetical protein